MAEGVCHGRGGMQRVSSVMEGGHAEGVRHGGGDTQRVSVRHWRGRHAEGLCLSWGEACRGSLFVMEGEACRRSQLAAVGGGKVVLIVEAQEVKRGRSENRVRQDQRAQS